VDPKVGLNEAEKKNFLTLPELKLQPLSRPTRRNVIPYDILAKIMQHKIGCRMRCLENKLLPGIASYQNQI
jgi:hypothetical protein